MSNEVQHVSTNSLYDVISLEEKRKKNYGVRNLTTSLVEYTCKTLPQAIAVSEQFDYMLQNDTWKAELSAMFGQRPGNIRIVDPESIN